MNLQTFHQDAHRYYKILLIFTVFITCDIVKLRYWNKKFILLMANIPFDRDMSWQWMRVMLMRNQQMHSGLLKPSYRCDNWSQEKRLCIVDSNVGNSVTFVIETPPYDMVGRTSIQWYQAFGFLNESAWKKERAVPINPKDPPWNMVIGSRGHELRISPITESDISINYFTVIAQFQHGSPKLALHFAIRPMPIDIGLVYPGDTLTIHMPSYVSLPARLMKYHWELENRKPVLPSNMRTSRSGATLTISELRKEQEGIVACGAFTKIGVFATQKRFRIRNVEPDFSQLIFEATRPPHDFIPLNRWNLFLENLPKYFSKRDARLLPKNVNDIDPQLLKQFLSKLPEVQKYFTENYNFTNKRKKRSPILSKSSEYFIEPDAPHEMPISNVTKDFYRPSKDPDIPPIAQDLNNHQGYGIPTKDESTTKTLNQFLSKMAEIQQFFTENHSLTNKRKKRSPRDGISEYLIEPDDNEMPNRNVMNDFKTPSKYTHFLSIHQNLNQLQDHQIPSMDDELNSSIEDDDDIPIVAKSKVDDLNEVNMPDIDKPRYGFYRQSKDPDLSSITRNLNERQDYQNPSIDDDSSSSMEDDDDDNPMIVKSKVDDATEVYMPDIDKPRYGFYRSSKNPNFPSITKRQGYNIRSIEGGSSVEESDFEAPMIVERKVYVPTTRSYFGDFNYNEDTRFEYEAMRAQTSPPKPTKPLSFLEKHKQMIRERLYGTKSKKKKTQKPKKKTRATTKLPENISLPPLQGRDIVANLMSACIRHVECAYNAECVKRDKRKPGFCRCRPNYEGNGLFCWQFDKSV